MRKVFFLATILSFAFIVKSQEKESKFVLGTNCMYRYYNYFTNRTAYVYPRLSLEYRLTKVSSFEIMAEYIDHTTYGRRNLSFPLSAGYKLNLVPIFTNNKIWTDRLRVYTALRYTFLPAAADPDHPFRKFYIFHEIRFAPGAEYYFQKHLGANIEMVFGDNLKTTLGLGIRYRF
jgi:hypothetical protein